MISSFYYNNVYKGFLYQISDEQNETKGYLFGTTHIREMMDQFYELDSQTYEAFNQSKVLVVEVDQLAHQEELAQKLKESPTLQKVATLMAKYIIIQMGFHSEGMEVKFINDAKEKQMPLKEIETIEEQLALLEKQEPSLLKLEDEKEYDKEYTKIKKVIKAYKNGSQKELEEILLSNDKGEIQEVFLNRNDQMSDKINHLLKEECLPFIAVGVGHLFDFGKGSGLIGLLGNKGWKIKRINE